MEQITVVSNWDTLNEATVCVKSVLIIEISYILT